MSVIAKFYVAEKTEYAGGNSGSVKLRAVTRGDQNAAWAAATPSGEINMHISNMKALHALVLGAEYLVTFTRETPATLADGHTYRPSGMQYQEGSCGECGLTKEAHEEPMRSELISGS